MSKATIEKIGTVENGQPMGFVFVCKGENAAAVINMQSDGSILWSGYTVEELKEIADKEDVSQ